MITMKPTVQDRSYAWVIVAASFFLHIIQDGVRFSYGLFFVEFLKEFGKGKGETAWVGSIMQCAFNLQGPVSAYIINRFGYRTSTIVGSLITCAGFLLSYFAPSLYYLYFTFGMLQGIGFGMVSLSSFVATVKYFKKRRALAVGISYSGGGIGTFAILPLARLIIDKYAWRGAMFILAGVALNMCVFASVLRPFIEDKSELTEAENETDKQAASIEENVEGEKRSVTSERNETINGPNGSCRRNYGGENNYSLSIIKVDQENTTVANGSLEKPPVNHISIAEGVPENDINNAVRSTKKLQHDSNEHTRFKNDFIEKILPKELVTNYNFIILMLSTVFIALPEFVPYSMLPDFALTVDCSSEQSAWTLSAIGIGALISQATVGWLADLRCVHNLSLLGGCILSIGLTTMIVAVIPMFETLITYSALYGILSGAMYTMQPIVILEYMDERFIATMQGLTMWVYGISGLLGSPAAGWLYDATASYKSSFLAAGACFALSGCINFLVMCTKRSRNARKLKKLKADT